MNTTTSPRPRSLGHSRQVIGSALIYLVAAVFLGSGSAKLAHLSPVVAEMTSLSLAGWKLNAVGALEIFTAILFLVPRWRSIGLLVMSAYLGGATCAHFMTNQYGGIGPAALFIAFCWVGTALKHPQAMWSFAGGSGSDAQLYRRPGGTVARETAAPAPLQPSQT